MPNIIQSGEHFQKIVEEWGYESPEQLVVEIVQEGEVQGSCTNKECKDFNVFVSVKPLAYKEVCDVCEEETVESFLSQEGII